MAFGLKPGEKKKGNPEWEEFTSATGRKSYRKKVKSERSSIRGESLGTVDDVFGDISQPQASPSMNSDAQVRSDGTIDFSALKGAERSEAIADELTEGMRNLVVDEEGFDKFMDFIRSSYAYSANNQMLLQYQKPNGSIFKTYDQWKEMGYQVAKGTMSATIRRPVFREENKTDKAGNPVIGPDGKPIKEMRLAFFKLYGVFSEKDLDTSVKEPPTNPMTAYFKRYMERDDIDDVQAMREDLTKVAEKLGIPVEMKNSSNDSHLAGGAGGYAQKTTDGYRIVLSENAQPHAVTHVLSHEMAHILCGHLDRHGVDGDLEQKKKTIDEREVEAEAMAYAISKDYGLEMGEFAFSYLKNWSGGDEKKITKAMSNVSSGLKKYYSELETIVTGTNQVEQNKSASEAAWKKKQEAKKASTKPKKTRKRTTKK